MKKPRPENSPIDPKRFKVWLDDFAAYRHAVTKGSIESWLNQFQEHHRDTAARILDAVEFFGADRIAAAFRKSLRGIPGWHIAPTKRKGRWRFVAYSGSAGESGDSMLHQFRLANGLDGRKYKELFIQRSEIVLQQLSSEDTLVFLDDFVGTGDQVCDSWTETFTELTAGVGRVYLIVVAAMGNARKRIESETDLTLVPCHELDDSDSVFSNQCVHFTSQARDVLLEGATREEALAKLRAKIQSRLKNGTEIVGLEVGPQPHPWMEFAGMFKDDPWIDDWKKSIEEYRQKVEDDPDAL